MGFQTNWLDLKKRNLSFKKNKNIKKHENEEHFRKQK